MRVYCSFPFEDLRDNMCVLTKGGFRPGGRSVYVSLQDVSLTGRNINLMLRILSVIKDQKS